MRKLMPSALGLWGDSLDHLVHLVVAFVLALPIGWHRAHEEQSAGLRTFPLVAIASCGLVQTAISVFGANATVNANIMQGVVTGIGFIGAGAIITVLQAQRLEALKQVPACQPRARYLDQWNSHRDCLGRADARRWSAVV